VSVVVTGVHDVISIFAMPGCSNTQGIKRNIKMNKALLSIIPATVNIVKLLPVLFLFTGFQGHAAPITTIGNLSYDGTLITGDGRTYLGLDTLAPLTYQQTLDKIANDPIYADYWIADNEDADYFLNSLFGDTSDNCSTTDGVAQVIEHCGSIHGWNDGMFGANYDLSLDYFFFIADEANDFDIEVGLVKFRAEDGDVYQDEKWSDMQSSDAYSDNPNSNHMISWLLVTDSNASNAVPTPSSFAIFVLGFAGIGFARRRRS
jgi:hypothetical protein